MFENIEKFYKDNHFKLIEDKSEGSLRPGKSFTKDVENCIGKFKEFYLNNNQIFINEDRLQSIIGGVDTNTRSQNLRVMREFDFLVELDTPMEDQSKFKLTDTFVSFVESEESPRDYIYRKLSSVSGIEDLTMYLNLLICTLREAYLYGQVMLFPDSDDKFKNSIPELEARNSYRKRIYEVYGYSGRDKQITDDVYSPNLSYMSRAELENLGLLVMTNKKVDNMNNLVLTKEGYELLCKIEANLAAQVDIDSEDIEERNKRLFKYWMEAQVKPEGDSDAGNPYSKDSINSYVSNIANTPMPDIPDKSIFYSTDAGVIQTVIAILDNSEKKNNTQRSAVRKYFEFIKETVVEDIADDILKHNLYGIHIKNKNDALAEDNSHICIGWSALGDLSDIKSKAELEKVFDDTYHVDNARSRGQQVGQVWRFCNELKVGDYVIYADSDVFHIGRVESDYYYDDSDRPEQDFDYKNNRKVKWLKKGISRSTISAEFHRALMTAMSIFTINDYKSAVVDLIKDVYVKDENEDMEEEYMELVYNTSLDSDFDRNRIIFGAPGTGKSFTLNEQAKGLIDATDGKVERVTFHPDYTYSQFVGAYKPTMDGKDIRYEFVPGPFMRVYVEALKSGRTDNPQPFLLIVEEINRAKVAGVFGDIFQLLDRDDDGVSVYEIQASEDIKKYLAEKLGGQPSDYTNIRIPNNMFIWATMNSADQGVFPMDTAFKRRWSFEYLGIDAGEDKLPTGGKFTIAGTEIEWNKLRKGINAKMTSPDFHINEDKLMGPFFLSGKLLKSDENGNIINPQKFIDVFKSKVLMYLYEDAIKQRKHDFFHNCDTSKYSSVCDAFDEHGIEIFGSNFMSDYYNK